MNPEYEKLLAHITQLVIERTTVRTDKLLTPQEARQYVKHASASSFSRFCRRNHVRPLPNSDLYARSALDLACDRESRRRRA